MAEYTITTGFDTWVGAGQPDKNRGGAKFLHMSNGSPAAAVAVSMPIAIPAGEVVLSAVLSVPVSGSNPTQTVSVRAFDLVNGEGWKRSRITWANRPPRIGTTAPSGATGALTDRQRIEVDVTALVQAIVAGQPNNGWYVTTSITGTTKLVGFESGEASWQLDIVTSDQPAAPTDLVPAGVISLAEWVVRVDEIDDLAMMQVQVDPAMSSSPAYTSAQVATTVPLLDLAAQTTPNYPGLADGATTYWRARYKALDGQWSEWSDWVQVTRDTKPTINLTGPPAAGTWYDATPTIAATLSDGGTANTRWQVIITAAGDPTDVRYDSGDDITGATLAHEIPLQTTADAGMWWQVAGDIILPVDGDYVLTVRAWDRSDRVPSDGDPTYIEVVHPFTLDTDADGNPPNTLTAVLDGPFVPDVRLVWTLDTGISDPIEFVVFRNGDRIAALDADEVSVGGDQWEWVDETAPTNVEVAYTVRAVALVAGSRRQTLDSVEATVITRVEGLWIRSSHGSVGLRGTDIDEWRQRESRTTFDLPYRREPVDIITAKGGGMAGTFTGILDQRFDQDVEQAKKIIELIRRDIATPVRLVAATYVGRVRLRNLSVSPSSQLTPGINQAHNVAFEFFEVTG